MELIDPCTGEPAYRHDRKTREWFSRHPDWDTWLCQCKLCGLFYKPSLEHKCEDLIDPCTGALLWPGVPERCPGNGEHPEYECCCDECPYYSECFPDWKERL